MARTKDITAGAALVGFSGLIYYKTLGLPGASAAAGGLGPASFPRALAVIIGALAAALFAQGLFQKPQAEKAGPVFGSGFAKMLAFFAAMSAYIILMPFVGFLVPTTLFLFSTMIIVMEKRPAGAVVFGLVFSMLAAAAVYYIFAMFLNVPLIEGPVDLFFRYTLFGAGG